MVQSQDVVVNSKETRSRHVWLTITSVVVSCGVVLAVQAISADHIGSVVEYDDGVYFGAALNFIHGVLPYKKYVFLQPPLIAVWLSPAAAFASKLGVRTAFELARAFTDLISLLNVGLVGYLLRKRTNSAIFIGTSIMALSISTIQASQTVLIEPFLVFLSLLSLIALLSGESITQNSRRLWLSGILFGLAGATKVWAIVPVLVVLAITWRTRRDYAIKIAVGTAVGFIATVGPLLLIAPSQLVRQVVLTQAIRGASGERIPSRIANLLGISYLSDLTRTYAVVGGTVTIAIALAALRLMRRAYQSISPTSRTSLGRIALWSTVTVGASLLIAPSYYYHYGAFLAPYVGLTVGTLYRPPRRLSKQKTDESNWRHLYVVLAVAVFSLIWLGDLKQATMPPIRASVVTESMAKMLSPVHGCVVTNDPAIAILAGHYTSDRAGCPSVVDWNGTERYYVRGISGEPQDNQNVKLQSTITGWLHAADAVILGTVDAGIGSTNLSYLNHHFRSRFFQAAGVTVYVRSRPRSDRPISSAG